jgi:hypothetical protein
VSVVGISYSFQIEAHNIFLLVSSKVDSSASLPGKHLLAVIRLVSVTDTETPSMPAGSPVSCCTIYLFFHKRMLHYVSEEGKMNDGETKKALNHAALFSLFFMVTIFTALTVSIPNG